MGVIDIVVFIAFIVGVVGLGLYKSGKDPSQAKTEGEQDAKQGAKDYFLAGGSLPWWVIGFSLIAANISTEQFVGMSGKAADWLGLAIASYEWLAAITLVIVAFVFLPKFLKCGIYTIPEFLEHRYDPVSRTVMAIVTMIILVGVPTAAVIYSGATIMDIFFKGYTLFGIAAIPITITTSCWIIGILATTYVFAGGLKACAWADLIQGSALIVGGAIVTWLGLEALGMAEVKDLVAAPNVMETVLGGQYINTQPAMLETAGAAERLWELNHSKFHMVMPSSDPEIPWTALVFFGLWIPNFFYWGLNQYITQRTLGAKSLNEGQKGVVFAAAMKLLIPFIVVVIGIMAFNLFSKDLQNEGRWKSAVVLAETPALYKDLPQEFKPDFILAEGMKDTDQKSETVHIYDDLVKRIADTPDTAGANNLYSFDKHFATQYPIAATRIYQHNYTISTAKVTDSGSVCSVTDALAQANAAILSDSMGMQEIFGANLANYNKALIARPTNAQSVKNLSGYNFDSTYGTVLRRLVKDKLPPGIAGFILAALFGAVVSSLASMLNSASTIFTMDIFHKLSPKSSQFALVTVGRIMTVVFVIIACAIAPILSDPMFGGIFTFIQEFQGFISPGILAIFIFGLLVSRAPKACGIVGLVLNPILYATCKWGDKIVDYIAGLCGADITAGIFAQAHGFMTMVAKLSFLDRMSVCFVIVLLVLTAMTLIKPLKRPVELPVNENMDLSTSVGTKTFGALVIVATVVLYFVFF